MRIGLVVVVCAVLGLAGCSGAVIGSGDSGAGAAVAGARLTGVVHGGQQALVGAHVYLLAAASGAAGSGNGAGMAAYGGAGIAASANNASVSLMTTGTLDQTVGAATNGDYYVTTDGSGNFTITGDYSCTAAQQVYLYVTGGDPGLETGVNPAAGLMAALGNCPGMAGSTGNAFSSGLYVVVNEVSTVAAAYAMAGFATDATHVGSSGTALALTGIANAFANAGNLADLGSGAALATTPVANGGNGTVPQAELNTLANILAACVNSNGAVSSTPSATPCYTLFTNATADGTPTGTQSADTATAAMNIAHNPGANVAALYGLSTASPPFAGGLTVVPNDFSVILFFGSTGGVGDPAIDGSGNVWMLPSDGRNAVFELSSSGASLSPPGGYTAGGYTAGGIYDPLGIAIDPYGDAWISNFVGPYDTYITELSDSGTAISPVGGFPFFSTYSPGQIAFDGVGDAWITNESASALTELASTGADISPAGGYLQTGDNPLYGIAIDSSNNLWGLRYNGTYSLSKTSNAGVALLTDITESAFQGAHAVAIDRSNNVWVADSGGNVFELDNNGVAISPSTGYTGGGIHDVGGIAIDGAGDVWVGNYDVILPGYTASLSSASLSEFSSTGTALTPSTGLTLELSTVFAPTSIAIDGSGNVWETNTYIYPNYSNFTAAEYVGVAAPVVTPLSVGVKTGTLGTRP